MILSKGDWMIPIEYNLKIRLVRLLEFASESKSMLKRIPCTNYSVAHMIRCGCGARVG